MQQLHSQLCAALSRQQQMSAEAEERQRAVLALTSQLEAAEAAVYELRQTVCTTRAQLLTAQCTTVAEVLGKAAAEARDCQPSTRPQEVEALLQQVCAS